MNCLILVAILLCCGGNCAGNCGNKGGCGCGWPFGGPCGGRRDSEDRRGCGGREEDCGCGNNGGRRERPEREDCGCNSDFRSESRFEQRPFLFNQSSDCGCDEPKNKGCDCDRQ